MSGKVEDKSANFKFSLEEAFLKLTVVDWEGLNPEFKMKYRGYRSKFKNQRGSIGTGIMIEMLEKCGYKIRVGK